MLLSNSYCFSQKTDFEKISRIHFQVLSNYQYDAERTEKLLDSLNRVKKGLTAEREQVLEKIIYSLELLNQKEVDSSFISCYAIFYSDLDLTHDDSLMLHQQLGHILLNSGEYVESKKHLLKALKIIRRHGYKNEGITSWLTTLYMNTRQYESAIHHLKKSETDSTTDKSVVYSNLGLMYLRNNNTASAMRYYRKTLRLALKGQSTDDFMYSYLGIANTYKQMGMEDSSLFYYKKCLLDTSGMTNWYPYIYANYNITEIYMNRQLYDSCNYYMKRFFLCPCLDFETKAWLYEFKADYYKKIGQSDDYLHNLKLASSSKDSLISELKRETNQISQISIQRLGLVEELLQAKSEKQEAIEQRSSLYRILFILSAFLLGLTIYFFAVRHKKNKELLIANEKLNDAKLNKLKLEEEKLLLEMKSKNIDLTQLITHITLNRQFIEDQKDKLNELQGLSADDIQFELQKYIREFNAIESVNLKLSSLQSRIDEVNSQLFLKLKEKFPDLTNNDLQICALHMLNLSSKEIAIIRNVTPKSIQVSRYRIKKKMGLTKDEDIVSYINKEFLSL